jgi:hypothetical protein
MLLDPDPHSHTDPDPGQLNLGALAASTFQADTVVFASNATGTVIVLGNK